MTFFLSRDAARKLDAEAIEHHGHSGIELMERAALGATDIAINMVAPGARLLIACGCGNNGGDGWAMARLLDDLEYDVEIITLGEPAPGTDAAINAERINQSAIQQSNFSGELPDANLVIDALFGTGLNRTLSGDALRFVRAINAHPAPVLAIDLPSGLDADTAVPLGDAVEAHATATLVGPKVGFAKPSAAKWIGEVHVIDLGLPPALVRRHALQIGGMG